MTKTQVKMIVDKAFYELERLCDSGNAQNSGLRCHEALTKAYGLCLDGERDHRRFLRGAPYRSVIATAAKYHIVHHVYNGPCGRRKPTWIEAATTRPDILQAWAIHMALEAGHVDTSALKDAAELDYVRDLVAR